MPRILPRLLKKIENQADQQKFFNLELPKSNPAKSLFKPPLPAPSFHPSNHPRSILLSPENPVTNVRDYARHKRIPPNLTGPGKIDPNDVDPSRKMSEQEFGWWANPYLRMLSSPIRACLVTQRRLPKDFLIRLTGMRIPSSRLQTDQKNASKLVPDGLLHPKYTNRKSSGGLYVLCWRKAVKQLEKGAYKRMSPELSLHSQLEQQIAHLLRLRVLQEFELLAEELEYAVKHHRNFGTSPVLRRLTREEWGLMRSTGSLPCQNALAILIVPPPNRNGLTKQRPKGSLSPLPPNDEHSLKNPPPTSTLVSDSEQSNIEEISSSLPPLQIPLYNSIAAFPSRAQRAALHSLLLRILTAEWFVKRHYAKKDPNATHIIKRKPANKGSHAFLLCADETTVHRGDSAAVALALWRLRMYDSEGWESS